MTTGNGISDQDLDALFAQARADGAIESADLMARVFADATRLQPHPAVFAPQPFKPRAVGFWGRLAASLGGKGVLAGLGTATVAGVMIGFAQPAPLTALADTLFAQAPIDEIELLPGIDAILTEG